MTTPQHLTHLKSTGLIRLAQNLRQQATEIITFIANHTPAALRTSFLNLPEVRATLGEHGLREDR